MRIQQHANRINSFIKLGLAIVVVLIALALTTGFVDNPKSYELKHDIYIVQYGDELDVIARKYKAKNTYGKREFDEFKQGIIELNVDDNPDIRYGKIFAGERLKVNYWIRKEVENNE